MSSVLYTLQECGCLALALVNEPDAIAFSAQDIAREARKGRALHEAPELPPVRCALHQAERDPEKAEVTP